MARNGKLNMKSLAQKFGTSLLLSEKENGGIKIQKKAVEGALLGFHYNVVAEVLQTKFSMTMGLLINSLVYGEEWRVCLLRALGGAQFMARFVGR